MRQSLKVRLAMIAILSLIFTGLVLPGALAEDLVHAVSGVVKSVDKTSKTVVIKTADGTEQTFKYTGKTTVDASKDTAKGVDKASTDTYLAAKKGSKVTVQYTEKGAEKTAVGIKDAVD